VTALDATAAASDTFTGATSYALTGVNNAVTANGIAATGIENVTTTGALVGSATGTTFNITGAGVVGVANINFTGVTDVTGGAGQDSFVFADAGSVTGAIDGGGPVVAPGDTLDLSAKTTAVAINTAAGTATGMGSFANIEHLTGNNANTTLTGGSFQLTGVNSGAVDGIGFQAVHHLQGTATSSFTGAGGSVAGAITGGGTATTLSGVLTSGGNQSYAGAVTLGAATTLSANAGAGTIGLGAVAGAGNDLTLTGAATLASGSNVGALVANQSLTTQGAVGANSVAITGTTTLGGNVTTAAGQTYTGGATLNAAVTLGDTGNSAINVGTSLTGGGNNLTIASGGTTTLTNATGIGTFTAGTNGTTNGAVTAGTYNLNGGTVNAALGAGTLNQAAGTTTLAGTSAATAVNVNSGTLVLGSNDRLADTAVVSVAAGAALGMQAFSDTVGSVSVGNGASVNGTGTLTAGTYTLNGGTVNANLGAGTLVQATNTSTLNGTSAAGTVNVNGGTLQLGATANRLTSATALTIASGATLNTGASAQALGTAAVNNHGSLVAGGAVSAGSITSDGSAAFGGNVTTTGDQVYTGSVSTAAGSTITAANKISLGSTLASMTKDASTLSASQLAVTDPALVVIGSGTTFRLTGAGSVDVAGDFAGSVAVDAAGATLLDLSDYTAATPFSVTQALVAPTASVFLTSAGAITVDAAQFSPVSVLQVATVDGGATFLNSSTARNGLPGMLATDRIVLDINGGSVNTAADPMWINPGTPNLSVSIDAGLEAFLAGNVSANAIIREILAGSADAVGAGRAEMVRDFLRELKHAVGVGAVEDLVMFGGADMEGITAPLAFRSLAIRAPKCVSEQVNNQPCQ
jgi:hypothetical protein